MSQRKHLPESITVSMLQGKLIETRSFGYSLTAYHALDSLLDQQFSNMESLGVLVRGLQRHRRNGVYIYREVYLKKLAYVVVGSDQSEV